MTEIQLVDWLITMVYNSMSHAAETHVLKTIDPFPKRHRLVHNGGFPTFEALYCGINLVNSSETF